jgi:hypothetical protein
MIRSVKTVTQKQLNTENVPRRERLGKAVKEILGRVDRLPTIDPRPADELLDYDENGLPR